MFSNLFNSEKYKKAMEKDHINELKDKIASLEQEIAAIDKHAPKIIFNGQEYFAYELLDGQPEWSTFTSYGNGQFTKPTYLKQQVRKLKKELEDLLAEEKLKNATSQASNNEVLKATTLLTQLKLDPKTALGQETNQGKVLEKGQLPGDNDKPNTMSLHLFSQALAINSATTTNKLGTNEAAANQEEVEDEEIIFVPTKKGLKL